VEKDPLNPMSFHDCTELSLGLPAFCLRNRCVEHASFTRKAPVEGNWLGEVGVRLISDLKAREATVNEPQLCHIVTWLFRCCTCGCMCFVDC
jgi:hypothetical protein